MKKALCIFLAILFVCSVIVCEVDEEGNVTSAERFSIEAFLNNITNFQDIPSMQDVAECWTLDTYYEKVNDLAGVQKYYEDYDGDDPTLEFFDSVRGFFKRLYRSVKIIAEMFVCILDNVQYLLPWNNTVPKGAI